MKIVVNKCYGGFSLSHEAVMRYAELKGLTLYPFVDNHKPFEKDLKKPRYRELTSDDMEKTWFHIHYSTEPLVDGGYKNEDCYFSDSYIDRDDLGQEWIAETHRTW